MKLYLAGVKSYQLDLGIDCKAFSDPRLERTIQGIKRDHNEPERRIRTPLTCPYLLKVLSALTGNYYEDVVIYTAFTLAFAGFLRVDEFTYKESDGALVQGFCNDPTIGSYNHYHLSPNGIPRGNLRWYGLV